MDDTITKSNEFKSSDIYNKKTMYSRNKEGYLMCEKVTLRNLKNQVDDDTFFVGSVNQLKYNIDCFQEALGQLEKPSAVYHDYSINGDKNLIKVLKEKNAGITVQNYDQVRALVEYLDYDPTLIMIDAETVSQQEMQEAIDKGLTFKISSEKQLDVLYDAADNCNGDANVILTFDADEKLWDWGGDLEINYDYLNCFFEPPNDFKYGHMKLVGINFKCDHKVSHNLFNSGCRNMIRQFNVLRKYHGDLLDTITIEGEFEPTDSFEIIKSMKDQLNQNNIKLIVQPGNSLVENTTSLLCNVDAMIPKIVKGGIHSWIYIPEEVIIIMKDMWPEVDYKE